MTMLLKLGWGIVLLGLIYVSLIANGMTIPRQSLALSVVVLGAWLCSLGGGLRAPSMHRNERLLFFLTTLVMGYFLVRGLVSPVWDFAKLDVYLGCGAYLIFWTSFGFLRMKTKSFMWALFVVFLVHGGISVYQYVLDDSYAFPHGKREDVAGVSGAYFHRNYFAGFLALAGPMFLGFSFSEKPARVWKIGALVVFLAGLFLCFLTNSRGGFLAYAIATSCVFLSFIELRKLLEKRARTFLFITGLFLGLSVLSWKFLQLILEKRGALEGGFMGRLPMAGIATDLWLQEPFLGQGARSFSYLYPSVGGIPAHLDDIMMAHCDFLQVLAEYGGVGFLMICALILCFLYLLIRKRREVKEGNWLLPCAFGVLISEIFRASFDFNLHFLPNILLFSMILGGALGWSREDEVEGNSLGKGGFFLGGSRLFMMLVCGGCCLWAGRKEILAAPEWFAVEQAQVRGEEAIEEKAAFVQKAPSFYLLRDVARASLDEPTSGENFSQRELEAAKKIWSQVLERNPYDGESLANYARLLDDTGEFGAAEEYHLRAIEAVGRRENKYGVISGVGWHLLKRGEQARLARKPEEALFLFEEAQKLFEKSPSVYFQNKERSNAIQWLKEGIEFLEGARIEPITVPRLDWESSIQW